MQRIEFTVIGQPRTKGSMRGFPVKRKSGRMGVALTDDNPKTAQWEARVAHAAAQAHGGPPLDGPVMLCVTFYLPRPKGHYGSGKNASQIKPNSPQKPIGKKDDIDKLLRALMDALTDILWRDDGQVVTVIALKRYGCAGDAPSTTVIVTVEDLNLDPVESSANRDGG